MLFIHRRESLLILVLIDLPYGELNESMLCSEILLISDNMNISTSSQISRASEAPAVTLKVSLSLLTQG